MTKVAALELVEHGIRVKPVKLGIIRNTIDPSRKYQQQKRSML